MERQQEPFKEWVSCSRSDHIVELRPGGNGAVAVDTVVVRLCFESKSESIGQHHLL